MATLEVTEEDFYNTKDEAFMFLIDTSIDGAIFKETLERIKEIVSQKMILYNHDLISVHLITNEKSEYIAELERFSNPNGTQLKNLDFLQNASFENTSLDLKESSRLVAALCKTKLSFESSKKAITCQLKKIFLFTSTLMQLAPEILSVCEDIHDLNIFIEIFPLKCSREIYSDITKFQKHSHNTFKFQQDCDNSFFNHKSSPKFNLELLKKWFIKMTRRSGFIGNIPFILGEDIILDVQIHSFIREFQKSTVHVYNNKVLKVKTKFQYKDDNPTKQNNIYLEADEKPYYSLDFDSGRILFCSEEWKSIKFFGPPSLRLIEFQSAEIISNLNVKKPFFIYPNQKDVVPFSCLLHRLVISKKIAICNFISLHCTIPRIVALIPQISSYCPSTGIQLQPDGFNLIILPYKEDIRDLSHLSTNCNSNLSPGSIQIESIVEAHAIDNFSFDLVDNPTKVSFTKWINLNHPEKSKKRPLNEDDKV